MSPARRLTARGRGLLAGSAGMGVIAALFGIQELYALAAAGVVLVICARLWVAVRRWDVEITRYVHPVRVAAGADARVELAAENQAGSRTPPIVAADPFDGGERWARFTISPMAPGERRRASYRLPTARRGVYHLGPLQLKISDPFGLAEATKDTAPDTTLTVHPRVEPVSVHSPSSHRDDDRLPLPVIGHSGNELYALREYVPGDDLRHVHWPSTARLDDLVVRQPEHLRRGRMTVAADLRGWVHDTETLEAVLSATASVAMSALGCGLQVRVVTTAGLDTRHGSGQRHSGVILDGLAAARRHRNMGATNPFCMAGVSDPVVVVTTDRATDADIESAFGLGGPSGSIVVIFQSEALPAGSPSASPGGRTSRLGRRGAVRVPAGGSFRAAWELSAC
ncbi:MAG: DUF58 domain-containing protein [Acidimicrobiales bacterium]|nr:DUF58 domain-containing protein [Acidimicrobiales bacterium]